MRIEHLSKHFGRGTGRVTALDDVSLEFAAGSFTAVLGASGSGKSTLLQCAAGLDRPSSGRVWLCGTDPASVSDRKRTLLRRRRVGFVFQDLSLLPELTVAENIALPLRLDRRRVTRAAIEDAAARVPGALLGALGVSALASHGLLPPGSTGSACPWPLLLGVRRQPGSLRAQRAGRRVPRGTDHPPPRRCASHAPSAGGCP